MQRSIIIIAFLFISMVTECCAGVVQSGDKQLTALIPERNEFALPSDIARLENILYGVTDKTVIIVRDTHANAGAQRNTARLLEYLHSAYGVSQCYVEGYDAPMDLSALSSFPFKEIRRSVGDNYLNNGLINGEEYLEVVAPTAFDIVGIEDRSLYNAHLASFRDVCEHARSFLPYLDAVEENICTQSDSEQSDALIGAFAELLRFQREPADFIALFDDVTTDFTIDKKATPNLYYYMAARRARSGIDLKQLYDECARIVALLQADMPEQLNAAFERLCHLNIRGAVKDDRFYRVLWHLLEGSSRSLSDYPAFERYIAYLENSAKIHPSMLLDDVYAYGIQQLKSSPTVSLTERYRALWVCRKMRRIASCSLTPNEAADLIDTNTTYIQADLLKPFCHHIDYDTFIRATERIGQSVQNYYRLAWNRDTVMAEHLLERNHAHIAVCITGGFHTDAIAQTVVHAGYTAIIVSPYADETDTRQTYLKLIAHAAEPKDSVNAADMLRQPALAQRPTDIETMGLDFIRESFSTFTDFEHALYHAAQLLIDVNISDAAGSNLLAQAVLYTDDTDIYMDFPKAGIALRIHAHFVMAESVIETITAPSQRIPQSAVARAPYQIVAAAFSRLIHAVQNTQASSTVNLLRPTPPVQRIIDAYTLLTARDVLEREDNLLLQAAIMKRPVFEIIEYNHAVTDIFMEALEGTSYPHRAGMILQELYRSNPEHAGLVLRSTGEGKHFQMGDILFSLDPDVRLALFRETLVEVSDDKVKEFQQIDRFALVGILSARHMSLSGHGEPSHEITELLQQLSPSELKIFISNAFQFFYVDPAFHALIRRFMSYVIPTLGLETLTGLFHDRTDADLKISRWLHERSADHELSADEVHEILERHEHYETISGMNINIDTLNNVLVIMLALSNNVQKSYEDVADRIQYIVEHIQIARQFFADNSMDRGILAWGHAADRIDELISLNTELSKDSDLRMMEYLENRIDRVAAEYITLHGLSCVKSILPHHRSTVVAKLTMVPDEAGLSLLLNNGLLEDSFAVVKQYPIYDASLARPRAIIAETGIGRREHAAKLAQHWGIPYLVIPHARKLLADVAGGIHQERWITLELIKGMSQAVVRRAAADEIEDEQQYRQTRIAPAKQTQPYTPRKLDLSAVMPVNLDSIGFGDTDKFGIKTVRLAYMKQHGVPVADGFGIPYGTFGVLLNSTDQHGRTLRDRIAPILAYSDFDQRREYYLRQIRQMILTAKFPFSIMQPLNRIYDKLDIRRRGVIVRSAVSDEDRPGFQTAGLYESFPNIRDEDALIQAILQMYASFWSLQAYIQREAAGTKHLDEYPSVVVQKMIDAKYSGVIETANVVNGSRNETAFSIAPGQGGGVEGESAEFLLDHTAKKTIRSETYIPHSLKDSIVASMSDQELSELDEQARFVVMLFDEEQNIEFAVDQDNRFWATQAQDLIVSAPLDEGAAITQPGAASGHTARVTLIDQPGLYSFVARAVVEAVKEYDAEVVIVTKDQKKASAKSVQELILLNALGGDQLLIEATGADAPAAVQAVRAVLKDPTLEKKWFIEHTPEYLVLFSGSYRGWHWGPINLMNDITDKYSDSRIIIDRLQNDNTSTTATDRQGLFDPLALVQYRSVIFHLKQIKQHSSLKLTTEGTQALDALWEMRKLYLYQYFGNKHDSERDIPVEEIIARGNLLTLDERLAIHALIEEVERMMPADVTVLEIDPDASIIGYRDSAFQHFTFDNAAELIDGVVAAFNREPYAIDYFIHALDTQLPGLKIIFTDSMDTERIRALYANRAVAAEAADQQPAPASREYCAQIKLQEHYLLTAYHAYRLGEIVRASSCEAFINRSGEGMISLTDAATLVSAGFMHGDELLITIRGADADQLLKQIMTFLTTPIDPSERFIDIPDSIRFTVRSKYGLHARPFEVLRNTAQRFVNTRLNVEETTAHKSAQPFTSEWGYLTFTIESRSQRPRGATFIATASGNDQKAALATLQFMALNEMFRERPSPHDIPLTDIIRSGKLFDDEEKHALDSLIEILNTTAQSEGISSLELRLFSRTAGYRDANNQFQALSDQPEMIQAVFDVLFREPYAEDYLLYHINSKMPAMHVRVMRDKDVEPDVQVARSKEITMTEFELLPAYLAHRIVDAANRFESRITIMTQYNTEIDAHSVQELATHGLERNDRFTIVAEGRDAQNAVAALEKVMTTPVPLSQMYSYDPSFLILIPRNTRGMHHSSLADRMCILAERFDANIDMEWIVQQTAEDGSRFDEVQKTWRKFNVALIDTSVPQNCRLRITAEGAEASAVLKQLHDYINIRMADEPALNYDVPLRAIIQSGDLLSVHEYDSIMAIIMMLKQIQPHNASRLVISTRNRNIGFMTTDNRFVPLVFSSIHTDNLFDALEREPYAEDFLLFTTKSELRGLETVVYHYGTLNTVISPKSIEKPLAVHTLTVLNKWGIHEAIASKICAAAALQGTDVNILRIQPRTGLREQVPAHKLWGVLHMALKQGEQIVLTAQGDHAEYSLYMITMLFNNYFGDTPQPSGDLPSGMNTAFPVDDAQQFEHRSTLQDYLFSSDAVNQSL